MGNERFSNDLWTRFVLDGQMKLLEIINPDDRLFFGKRPVPGKTLTEAAGEENGPQAEIIAEGLRRARREKRNTCFEYLSAYAESDSTHVCVHIEYRDDGSLCLYLAALDARDLHQ